MADRLKKAAVWLGLATDHEYAEAEVGADDVTEEVLERSPQVPQPRSVTELESHHYSWWRSAQAPVVDF